MTGPWTSRAIAWTASKSPGEAIGKPASMMSTPQARELVGDLELLAGVERDAGRLLAVAQRRVEDQYSVGVHVVLSLSASSCGFFSGWVCGSRGRHALFPPKGEEKKSKVEQERHARG